MRLSINYCIFVVMFFTILAVVYLNNIPKKETFTDKNLSTLNPLLYRLKDNIKKFKPDYSTIDEHGWMDNNVLKVFEKLDKKTDLFMIEVGTWKGKSAITFGKHLKSTNGQLLCIDTWLGAPEFYTWGINGDERGKSLKWKDGYPTVYYTFLTNIFYHELENTIIPFPISSEQAADVLVYYQITADAVYVDGSHEENSVYNDIQHFWDLLNPGGIIFGDDYNDYWIGVKKAVTKFVKTNNLSLEVFGVVWMIQKPHN